MKVFLYFFLIFLISCGIEHKEYSTSEKQMNSKPDIQGHRGARGLMPENTWPGFKKALDLGVKTLEMDVVITKDKKVILSHEPWFSHEIALDPQGMEITEENEKEHRIYAMTFAETKKYDCGSKDHPRFPEQEKINLSKPLLTSIIDSAETYCRKKGRPLPYYNIETKCTPEGDDVFHPRPEEFVDLLVNIIIEKGIADRAILQSFDFRTLKIAHEKYPELQLAMLIEERGEPSEYLELLGFTPEIYSPDFQLVNEELISFAKEKGMKVIPWTVNDQSDMERLIAMGVDGIITDYPDRYRSEPE